MATKKRGYSTEAFKTKTKRGSELMYVGFISSWLIKLKRYTLNIIISHKLRSDGIFVYARYQLSYSIHFITIDLPKDF